MKPLNLSKKRQKKSQTNVITMVIVILVVIVAVVIIAFFLKKIVKDKIEEAEAFSLIPNMHIKDNSVCINKSAEINVLYMGVQADANQNGAEKIKIKVENENSGYQINDTVSGILPLETKTFAIILTTDLTERMTIEIYPVTLLNGKERTGAIADSYIWDESKNSACENYEYKDYFNEKCSAGDFIPCALDFGSCANVSGSKNCNPATGFFDACNASDPRIANCAGKECGNDLCGGMCLPGCTYPAFCNSTYKCENPSCADSDNGKNYTKKGNILINNETGAYSAYDGCIDSVNLKEWYCEGVNLASETYECPLSCFNGSCLTKTMINPSLVAYYPFEGNAKDYSGYGNNGTLFGGVTQTTGIKGSAYYFNGVNGEIVLNATSGSLWCPYNNGVNRFTVSAWVNISNVALRKTIISKQRSSNPSGGQYYFVVESNNVLQGNTGPYISGSCANWPGGVSKSTQSVSPYKWTHVAFVVNYTGGYSYYINGSLAGSGQQTQYNSLCQEPGGIFIPLYIGAWNNAGGSWFSGSMDELRIYYREALNSSEIIKLYQNDLYKDNLSVNSIPRA